MIGREERAGAATYCAEGLDSRIMVSETRREAGRAFAFRGGWVNSTSSSHLGRPIAFSKCLQHI